MRSLTYLNPSGQSLTFQYSPLIESLTGIDQPSLALQSQKAPFQDGSTLIDELFDDRVISMDAAIAAGSLASVFALRNTIHSVLNPKLGAGVITLVTDAGTKIATGVPSVVKFANKASADGFQRFHVEFDCPDPYFYSNVQSTVSAPSIQGKLIFPISFPTQFSARSTIVATSAGHSPTPVTIVFTGPATNPKVLNQTTGQYIRCIKTLAAGDTLTIKTAFGQKSVIFTPSGGAGVSAMNTLDLASVFWLLQPGSNTILFTDDLGTTTAACSVLWNDRFIGV